MRNTWLVKATLGAVLLACNSNPTGNGAGCKSTGALIVTAADNHTFSPANLQINQGQSVCFENNGTLVHSVTPDSLLPEDSSWIQFGEQALAPGLQVLIPTNNFVSGRNYYYHCKFHGGKMTGMYGVIEVR